MAHSSTSFRRLMAAGAGLSVAAGLFAGAAGARAATPSDVMLNGQVVPGLSTMRALGALSPTTALDVEIMLQRDSAAVARFEASQYDARSADYRQWLTPAQFEARFGTPAAVLNRVDNFATAQGLMIVNAGNTGTGLVILHGTAAQVERTFSVSLNQYRDATGRTFYANPSAAMVPAGLGIQAVLGLENFHQLHLASMGSNGGPIPVSQPGCTGTDAVQNVCYGVLGPQDLWGAYGVPSDNAGQGQSLGVIGEGESADVIKALREYEKTRSLPHIPVQVYHTVPYDDTPGKADDAGRVEWEMDTQSSTTMAPHAREVRLYFGKDLSLSGLAASVQTWASDPHGPNQVSASLGACEEQVALDQLGALADQASSRAFAQAATEGRTFFASAGDTGAGCAVGPAGVNGVTYGPVPSPEFPAIDPNVTGVGGTVVYTDGAGGRVDEHAWDHGGGTRSAFIAQPSYQSVVPLLQTQYCVSQEDGTPYTTPTLCRAGADVSALSGDGTIVVQHEANHNGPQFTMLPGPYPYPLAGMFVANGIDMVDTGDQGATYNEHFSEGGTSLSSPLWLGMWARVNAASAKPLGQSNYTIYPIASAMGPTSALPGASGPFHDITEGGNPLPALPGWDFATGWGSPDVAKLTAAANNGHTAALSKVEPSSGADPAPIEPALSGPPCATLVGQPGKANSANLDIIEGDISLSRDGKSLRVSLSVTNMSENFPAGMDDMTYNVFWNPVPQTDTDKTTNYTATQVEIRINPGSSPDVFYTDGIMNIDAVAGNNTYTAATADAAPVSGTIVDGPGGRVEVDVPLADIGNPARGAHLKAVQAQTAEAASTLDPTGQVGTQNAGLVEDSASASADYVVGSPSCLDQSGPVVAASQHGGGASSGTQPGGGNVTPAIGLPNTSAGAGPGAVAAVAFGLVPLVAVPLGRRLRARRSR